MDGKSLAPRGPIWTRERRRLLWAVRVRWAVIAGFSALALSFYPFGVFADLAALLTAGTVGCVANLINHACVRRDRAIVAATVLALVMDNVLITYVAAKTGGLHSPMVTMYSIQVVTTAMLVTARTALLSAVGGAIGAAVLVSLESSGATGPGLLYAAEVASQPARAAHLAALAWASFLAYGLTLLVFVGGFLSERLRRSETELAEQNRQLAGTVASLEVARDELATACRRLQQAEAQLVQTEKMRALGQVVAGVAHELNNPISFVSSNIEALRGYFGRLLEFVESAVDSERGERESRRVALAPVLDDVPIVLDDCEEGARRVKHIVSDLRTFARQDAASWEATDINRCLERTLRVLHHRFRDGRHFELKLGEVPAIRALSGQLEQVFLNLVANAVDAIGDAGLVRISSRHDDSTALVHVRVADDGAGIAPENLDRVFEPFFTTKPVGQGTGIGLSLSYAIVQRHGGSLTVASELGQGAEFEVVLPSRNSVNSAPE